MYQPSAFVQHDPQSMAALLGGRPLATLVHTGPDGVPAADLIPLLWEPDATGLSGRLLGHVARANPLWQAADGKPVLALFHGPQAYVSPSWYPSKAESGQVVPTWNYVVVQAHGRLRAIDDAAWLRSLVEALTDRHESPREEPWAVSDAPAPYLDKMLRAIVGIEIAVERLEGKWKVSQNRTPRDRLGVETGLRAEPGDDARAMASLVRPPSDSTP